MKCESDEKTHHPNNMTVKKTSQAGKPGGKQGHSSPAQRILVVDDDEDIRRFNVEILTSSGYRVDAAADGALALASLQINNYDLLLTDYGLPKVNGLDLIKKIRAAHMVIPVILASGTMPTEELKHPELHIEAMLPKPYTFEQLLETVRKVLSATHDTEEEA
jgi:DNA-binding response OmpR family regulator